MRPSPFHKGSGAGKATAAAAKKPTVAMKPVSEEDESEVRRHQIPWTRASAIRALHHVLRSCHVGHVASVLASLSCMLLEANCGVQIEEVPAAPAGPRPSRRAAAASRKNYAEDLASSDSEDEDEIPEEESDFEPSDS